MRTPSPGRLVPLLLGVLALAGCGGGGGGGDGGPPPAPPASDQRKASALQVFQTRPTAEWPAESMSQPPLMSSSSVMSSYWQPVG